MQYRPCRIEQRGPERRLTGTEGDGLDAAALGADQRAAHMALAHRLRVVDAYRSDHEPWQGVAGAERPCPLDHADQLLRRGARRQSRVDAELAHGGSLTELRRDPFVEKRR